MSQQVKERPILFSAPMVRAILEGRKSVTRRPVKVNDDYGLNAVTSIADGRAWFTAMDDTRTFSTSIGCPYGQPGDRLWVRETFYAFGRWITRFSAKKGRDEWHFVDMTLECGHAYLYDADGPNVPLASGRGALTPGWYKRPAIFMPRAASRIQPEVTEVRVERLQDISEEQAKAEGIIPHPRGGWHWHPHNVHDMDDWHQFGFKTAYWAFHDLWIGINGPEAWEANLWVWAVSFRRVEA